MKKPKPKAKKDGASPAFSVTPANIAKRLRWLSHRMQSVGAEMEYYGGFGEIGEHGREMQGAASIALGWAKGIEASLPNIADQRRSPE